MTNKVNYDVEPLFNATADLINQRIQGMLSGDIEFNVKEFEAAQKFLKELGVQCVTENNKTMSNLSETLSSLDAEDNNIEYIPNLYKK